MGNTMNDQGIILCGQAPAGVSASSFNGCTLTQAQSLMNNYKIIPLRSGCQVTWTPESQNDVDTYYNPTGTPAPASGVMSMPLLVFLVYGANAASACILIDFVCNYQGQYANPTFMPGGLETTSPPAEPGWYERAKNLLSGLDPIVPFVSNSLATMISNPVAQGIATDLYRARIQPVIRNQGRLQYMTVD